MEQSAMTRPTAFFRSVFFWSVNLFAGATLALAADEPAPDLGLPAPRAGESVGLAKLSLDGKPFSFNQIVAYQTLYFGNPTLALFFSDQPVAVEALKANLVENRGDDSDFGMFKTHLKLYCSFEGKPQSCSFWKDNWSVSVSGAQWQGGLVVKNGRVRGKVTLEQGDEPGKRKSFDVRVDAQIVTVPLPPAATSEMKKTLEPIPQPIAPGTGKPLANLKAKSLPMPADATDVEYKELVEQITYKSRNDVQSLAAFLSKGLAAQGWKTVDDDLVTQISAILTRKRGDAELTIFIKPAASGSVVQMMTDGLDW
jgi:hypothetical protein